MTRRTLAVNQAALNQPLRRSLAGIRKMQADGLELAAIGEMAPAKLTATGRRELRHLALSHELSFAALSCPLRDGLEVADDQEGRIERLSQAMKLAVDLGCTIVVVQPGPLVTDVKDPRFAVLADSLATLGRHGDRIGVRLALTTGFDSAETVMTLLTRFDTGGLAVAVDPGGLMAHGHDPYASLRTVRSRLAYVRASDAKKAGAGRLARRVPVGRGDLDWLQLAANMEEVDYRGWITVDGESATEASAGVAFLKRVV
ncbi:MAG TPA: sugar phosphate isomerase/epimerase family protein [Gemmataceae bacterium]|jgi:sugar phosphate isomerase/epimerase|nr:sugar phosphate isomerase/epimerase family protein [Gemmataceae bacterium]